MQNSSNPSNNPSNHIKINVFFTFLYNNLVYLDFIYIYFICFFFLFTKILLKNSSFSFFSLFNKNPSKFCFKN